jgi:protein TonB
MQIARGLVQGALVDFRGFAIAALISQVVSGGVQAAERPIIEPGWRAVDDVSQFYPERAQRMEVNGWARLRCLVGEDYRAKDCIVVGQNPAGYGFDWAALHVIARGRFDPVAHGEPTVGHIVIKTISFAQPRNSAPQGDGPASDYWSKEPSSADVAHAHPRGADDYGMADVTCQTVSADGALSDCSVQSEAPAGQGLGDAALGLAGLYRLKDVRPQRLQVSFFVTWTMPGSNVMPTGTSLTLPQHPEPGWRPVFVPMVTVLDPRAPGGVSKPQATVFLAAPDKTQIEAVRPPGPKVDASVSVKCEVAQSGALAGCVTTAFRGADASYITAAASLLPLYRVSSAEIAAFAAEPRASFHVNWSPR